MRGVRLQPAPESPIAAQYGDKCARMNASCTRRSAGIQFGSPTKVLDNAPGIVPERASTGA